MLTKIYKGSNEVSDEDQRKVVFGVLSLVIGFFVGMFSGVVLLSRYPADITMADLEGIFANISIIAVFTGILFLGGLLLLIYELGSDKQKKYMLGVLSLYIVMSIGLAVVNKNLPKGDEYEII